VKFTKGMPDADEFAAMVRQVKEIMTGSS